MGFLSFPLSGKGNRFMTYRGFFAPDKAEDNPIFFSIGYSTYRW